MNNENCKKMLNLYVHIPFCIKKCSYCDFISFENRDENIEKYITALKQEINTVEESDTWCPIISTIYIGGGTPSYIDSKYIAEILSEVKRNFQIDKKAEITLEINPRNCR